MVIYTLGPFVGPTVGPVVGGFINQHASWRWTFYVVIIWSGIQVFLLRGVSLMQVCPQFVCSGNVWTCRPETESKVPTKPWEHNEIQSSNGTANKIHHHHNPTILHSTLSYSSHLTHLTIRTSIRRTNMLFIMSLFIFPPCNFIPLLWSVPPCIQKQSWFRVTIHRSLLHWSGNRRSRRPITLRTSHKASHKLDPPRQESRRRTS